MLGTVSSPELKSMLDFILLPEAASIKAQRGFGLHTNLLSEPSRASISLHDCMVA